MAWLGLHDTARDNDKIAELAEQLGITHAQALGHLAMLWLATIKDGDLTGCTDGGIGLAAGWQGAPEVFVAALIERRRIEVSGEQLVIHDWAAHRGSVAEAKRKARSRAAKHQASHRRRGVSRGISGKPSEKRQRGSRDSKKGLSRDNMEIDQRPDELFPSMPAS